MSRRRRRKFPREPFETTVEDLSHDGRGVATYEEKKVFIHGALPGERITARLTGRRRSYDEGETIEILEPSPDRIEPRCPHFGQCGGCSLQHLDPARQIEYKQRTLEQNLARIGKVSPETIWEPLTGPLWGYRRKARLSVRYVHKKERVLVGFRERYGAFVADMSECHVLDPRVASELEPLSACILSMEARRSIPQIEVACGDNQCALVFRHLESLSETDMERLREFARASGIAVLLQPGGPATVHTLEPKEVDLGFGFQDLGVELAFGPADFVQVNGEMNRLMVARALELLDPGPQDRILDLFCGLGNFTLPIATRCGSVVGVEGDTELVRKGTANAQRNGLENAEFFAADLAQEPEGAPWLKGGYDKVLVDPPRSGAEFILPHVAASGAQRLVYVSCHPASLARDAGILVHEHGFRLKGAGVMDMFPHTGHVESIALFERPGGEK
ncbi:MAG: 23S rRNA (uracil(1939)-C(5))-methyltransferase RlmD [Lysobacterales bacterium]|jgi:23S rRNA (uracil1939-C5)-methyltransferase